MWQFLPMLIGAGTSLLGANQQSKAINQAANAQQQTAQQQMALFQQARQGAADTLGKYAADGDAARSRMMALLGLGPSRGAATPQGSAQGLYTGSLGSLPTGDAGAPAGGTMQSVFQSVTGGRDPSLWNGLMRGDVTGALDPLGLFTQEKGDNWQPVNTTSDPGQDYRGYFTANPDVKAEWDQFSPDEKQKLFAGNPDNYAAWHFKTFGQAEGRSLTPVGQAPAGAGGAGGTAANSTMTADEAREAAWSEYEKTPWAQIGQTEANTARDDFLSRAGASGSALSGRTARGMAEVANEAKLRNFGGYFGALGGVADTGFTADSGIASGGSAFASNAANVLSANGQAAANAAVAQGQNQQDMFSDLSKWVGWGLGNFGGSTSAPQTTDYSSAWAPTTSGRRVSSGLGGIR